MPRKITPDDCCTYCAAPADEWDHVIPRNVLRPSGGATDQPGDWIVLACRECNRRLQAVRVYTIADRARVLLRRYRMAYRKLLIMPTWTDEELEELEYNLRQMVLRSRLAQAELDMKLAHLRWVSLQEWDYLRPQ